MGSITRNLRLNPWTTLDVKAGKEPALFDFHEPDPLDDFINKAGSLFVRMTEDDWGRAGCPSRITVTLTATDMIEEHIP